MARSDGRPSQDAEYQNLKSGSNMTTRRITAQEVASSVVIAGEVVSDVGAFNTLNVDTLTVTNSNAFNEILYGSHVILPLAFATLVDGGAGSVKYEAAPNPNITISESGASDTASWTVYVPNSGSQRRIRVTTNTALGVLGVAPNVEVLVNGTLVGTALSSADLVNNAIYVNVYETIPFDWTTGAAMTVTIQLPVLGGPSVILSDNVIVW